jgi:sec-independent protein translocase protein TatC
VSLELPLLLVMLNFAGVLRGAKLAQARRYAFFGLVVFAALVVPGNDPISMGVLALTLCILYEAAVQVSKANDRRKAKRAGQSMAELPDDVASSLEPSSGDDAVADLDVPSPVGAPEPVTPSAPASDGPAASGGAAGAGGRSAADRWSDAGDAT